MLSLSQLEHFRSILEDEKEMLSKQIKAESAGSLRSERDAVGELSAYDNHPADLGTELFEREKDLALNELRVDDLTAVNKALEVMENGQYGKCIICQQEIPLERLEAIPATLYCKEHSPAQAMQSNRPVEEETELMNYPADKRIEYDTEDTIQDVMNYGSSETQSDFATSEELDYNEMFIDSEEPVGYVEDFENFIGTDMYGNHKTIYGVKKYQQYEQLIDDYEEKMIDGVLFDEYS